MGQWMKRRMTGWMGGWIGKQMMNGWIVDEWMDKRTYMYVYMDEWMEERKEERVDGWMGKDI